MPLGENIKYLRTSRNMTLAQVGDAVGVQASQVGAYEKGRSFPTYAVLMKLLELFDVKANDLIHRDIPAEGLERDDKPSQVNVEALVAMYQREIESLTSQLKDERVPVDLESILLQLEPIAPDLVAEIRGKHGL